MLSPMTSTLATFFGGGRGLGLLFGATVCDGGASGGAGAGAAGTFAGGAFEGGAFAGGAFAPLVRDAGGAGTHSGGAVLSMSSIICACWFLMS